MHRLSVKEIQYFLKVEQQCFNIYQSFTKIENKKAAHPENIPVAGRFYKLIF